MVLFVVMKNIDFCFIFEVEGIPIIKDAIMKTEQELNL